MENLLRYVKDYEIQERIGVGGFGAVYRAYQARVEREVAIKVILPDVAKQPEFIRRFEAEAQLIARLEHMNIVPLYDYWRDPEGAYLIMRYLRGGSLADRLKQGHCGLELTGTVLTQIASALTVAHRNNIIHRDIKPANILLDDEGNAYLTDFGIAKDYNRIDGSITAADVIIGSLDYISPEQARSEAVTPKTDIYSLGVVLYEMLTGEHPFPDTTSVERLYKHINDPLPEITQLPLKIIDSINQVIQRATAKKPDQRYKDVISFANAYLEAAQLTNQPMPESLVETLSPREQEILQLMINGLSNREIAERLVITVSTVKATQSRIYRRLRVKNRVQAIARGRELDLIYGEGKLLNDRAETSLSLIAELPEPENPFKGLQAFQSADSQDFFGREDITDKLINRLGDQNQWSRFLAVIGPSGSGKSSLVRAGLIPAIWRGGLPRSDRWFTVEMLPGTHPLEELEVALQRISTHQGRLIEHLASDSRGLLRAAQLILPDDDSELVLIIDQFEEVFTLIDDETQRRHFLNLLYTTVTDPRSRIRIIITLRADFYDRPLCYSEFGEMLRNRMETIMPLSADELERAIVNPVKRMGVKLEDGLVSSIIDEVSYQPGALPLLQYALTELFDRRDSRTLTHQAYREMGGTVGALAQRADQLFDEFDHDGQETIRQMFLRLVTLGEGVEDTRRRTHQTELLDISSDVDGMNDVISTYASYRLLSLDHDPVTRTPTVEVAHEAILSQWERLRNWINESREEIKMQQQLSRMADEWEVAEKDVSYLARGLRLEQFEAWIEQSALALTENERQFLQSSIAERSQQKTREDARKDREIALERRSQRTLRVLVAVFAISTIIAVLLAGTAVTQRNEAERNAAIVQQQSNENRSLYLTIEGKEALRNDDVFLGLALAVEAVQVDDTSEQANIFLNEMVSTSAAIRRFVGHTDAITTVAYSPDSNMAISGSNDKTLILWDLATGELIRRFEGHDGRILDVAFSADGNSIFSSSLDKSIIQWDVADGDIIHRFEGHPDAVHTFDLSPNGRTLLSGSCADDNTLCENGEIILWDIISADILTRVQAHDGHIYSVTFSKDGQSALTASSKNVIHWQVSGNILEEIAHPFADFKSFKKVYFNPEGSRGIVALAQGSIISEDFGSLDPRLADVDENITSIALSTDNRFVISATDNMITLFNVVTQQEQRRFVGHTKGVTTVAISSDEQTILSGSRDNTLILWEVNDRTKSRDFSGHQNGTWGMAVSPDGNTILGGGAQFVGGTNFDPDADNSLIFWDVETGEIIRQLEGHDSGIVDIVISPDGRKALSGSDDNTIAVWDMTSGELLNRFELPSDYLAFSPDGQMVISSTESKPPVLWNIETGEIIHTLTDFSRATGNAVAFSPDGKIVASTTSTGIAFWDVETGEEIQSVKITGQTSSHDMTFSPNGQLLATSSLSVGISIIDVGTGEVLQRFREYDNGIRPEFQAMALSVAFSDDNRKLLSGWGSNAVVQWDLASGIPTLLGNHNSLTRRVAFAPDGTPISSSSDGTVRMWGLGNEDLLDIVKNNRYLPEFTCFERAQYRIEPQCVNGIIDS